MGRLGRLRASLEKYRQNATSCKQEGQKLTEPMPPKQAHSSLEAGILFLSINTDNQKENINRYCTGSMSLGQ